MEDTPTLEEDVYAEFYDVDEPVIKLLGGINEVTFYDFHESFIEIL